MRKLKDGIQPLVRRIMLLVLQSIQNSSRSANCLWTLYSSLKSRLLYLISFKAQKIGYTVYLRRTSLSSYLQNARGHRCGSAHVPSRTTMCTSFRSSRPCTPRRRRRRPRCHWPHPSSTCRSSLCYSRRVAATRLRKMPRCSLSSRGGNGNGDANSSSAPHTTILASPNHIHRRSTRFPTPVTLLHGPLPNLLGKMLAASCTLMAPPTAPIHSIHATWARLLELARPRSKEGTDVDTWRGRKIRWRG